VGPGTVVYAMTIGPVVHRLIPLLTFQVRTGTTLPSP
jgi:hypothetical protein